MAGEHSSPLHAPSNAEYIGFGEVGATCGRPPVASNGKIMWAAVVLNLQ